MEWLFSINFWGAVRMTRAFLPQLKAADQAQIVAISSLFGLIAPPGQTAYAASKFAVRGFFEALRKEMADGPVKVTVVHPGGVATRIAKDARGANADDANRFDRLLRLPAEACGEQIAVAIERRTERLIVGRDAKLAALIERIMPVNYWRLIGRHAQ
jgi:short-subunit dehydrogenase